MGSIARAGRDHDRQSKGGRLDSEKEGTRLVLEATHSTNLFNRYSEMDKGYVTVGKPSEAGTA